MPQAGRYYAQVMPNNPGRVAQAPDMGGAAGAAARGREIMGRQLMQFGEAVKGAGQAGANMIIDTNQFETRKADYQAAKAEAEAQKAAAKAEREAEKAAMFDGRLGAAQALVAMQNDMHDKSAEFFALSPGEQRERLPEYRQWLEARYQQGLAAQTNDYGRQHFAQGGAGAVTHNYALFTNSVIAGLKRQQAQATEALRANAVRDFAADAARDLPGSLEAELDRSFEKMMAAIDEANRMQGLAGEALAAKNREEAAATLDAVARQVLANAEDEGRFAKAERLIRRYEERFDPGLLNGDGKGRPGLREVLAARKFDAALPGVVDEVWQAAQGDRDKATQMLADLPAFNANVKGATKAAREAEFWRQFRAKEEHFKVAKELEKGKWLAEASPTEEVPKVINVEGRDYALPLAEWQQMRRMHRDKTLEDPRTLAEHAKDLRLVREGAVSETELAEMLKKPYPFTLQKELHDAWAQAQKAGTGAKNNALAQEALDMYRGNVVAQGDGADVKHQKEAWFKRFFVEEWPGALQRAGGDKDRALKLASLGAIAKLNDEGAGTLPGRLWGRNQASVLEAIDAGKLDRWEDKADAREREQAATREAAGAWALEEGRKAREALDGQAREARKVKALTGRTDFGSGMPEVRTMPVDEARRRGLEWRPAKRPEGVERSAKFDSASACYLSPEMREPQRADEGPQAAKVWRWDADTGRAEKAFARRRRDGQGKAVWVAEFDGWGYVWEADGTLRSRQRKGAR